MKAIVLLTLMMIMFFVMSCSSDNPVIMNNEPIEAVVSISDIYSDFYAEISITPESVISLENALKVDSFQYNVFYSCYNYGNVNQNSTVLLIHPRTGMPDGILSMTNYIVIPNVDHRFEVIDYNAASNSEMFSCYLSVLNIDNTSLNSSISFVIVSDTSTRTIEIDPDLYSVSLDDASVCSLTMPESSFLTFETLSNFPTGTRFLAIFREISVGKAIVKIIEQDNTTPCFPSLYFYEMLYYGVLLMPDTGAEGL